MILFCLFGLCISASKNDGLLGLLQCGVQQMGILPPGCGDFFRRATNRLGRPPLLGLPQWRPPFQKLTTQDIADCAQRCDLEMQCVQIKGVDEDTWQPLQAPITGFWAAPGSEYKLELQRGSARSYKLVQQVSCTGAGCTTNGTGTIASTPKFKPGDGLSQIVSSPRPKSGNYVDNATSNQGNDSKLSQLNTSVLSFSSSSSLPSSPSSLSQTTQQISVSTTLLSSPILSPPNSATTEKIQTSSQSLSSGSRSSQLLASQPVTLTSDLSQPDVKLFSPFDSSLVLPASRSTSTNLVNTSVNTTATSLLRKGPMQLGVHWEQFPPDVTALFGHTAQNTSNSSIAANNQTSSETNNITNITSATFVPIEVRTNLTTPVPLEFNSTKTNASSAILTVTENLFANNSNVIPDNQSFVTPDVLDLKLPDANITNATSIQETPIFNSDEISISSQAPSSTSPSTIQPAIDEVSMQNSSTSVDDSLASTLLSEVAPSEAPRELKAVVSFEPTAVPTNMKKNVTQVKAKSSSDRATLYTISSLSVVSFWFWF